MNILATDDRLHAYDQLRFSFLRLNTRSEGLSNPLVRRAISLAFDRKGYLDGLGNITAQPALGSVPGGLILDGKDYNQMRGVRTAVMRPPSRGETGMRLNRLSIKPLYVTARRSELSSRRARR